MKKRSLILLAVILLLLLSSVLSVSAAQVPAAEPRYINAADADVFFSIDEDGNASFTVTCTGKSTTTGIMAITYLEYKSGWLWRRVDIGTESDEWTFVTGASSMRKTYTRELRAQGEYRVVTEFTVYGTVQDETFTLIRYSQY